MTMPDQIDFWTIVAMNPFEVELHTFAAYTRAGVQENFITHVSELARATLRDPDISDDDDTYDLERSIVAYADGKSTMPQQAVYDRAVTLFKFYGDHCEVRLEQWCLDAEGGD